VKFSNLDRGEILAIVGGVVLAIAVFLPWFTTGNANASINGISGADKHVSAWEALNILRIPLAAGGDRPGDPGVHHRP